MGATTRCDPARRAADRLLELQRPDGGWPWIFDTRSGRVVEPYEVYSVHQDAMAPMALSELTEVSGDERYRDAAIRGLDWVFGTNELGRPMLDRDAGHPLPLDPPPEGLRPRRPLREHGAGGRAAAAAWPSPARALEVNPTDRPYHLGWILEAWAGREPALVLLTTFQRCLAAAVELVLGQRP